ncbi:MAG: ATP-dependent DNA helicase [Lachnospiraceae bacterium]|nr:ATP-dependent DNA helicase [Lachnospiraceae bacterium]
MKTINISVRNLVEFIFRNGDIDERRGQGGSVEAMLEGARIHRAIQSAAGSDYSAEVAVREEITLAPDLVLALEGRADGIIDNKGYITVDEIKGMYLNVLKLTEPFEVHLAQAKCYAYIWAAQHGLSDISVRMTYVGIEDRQIKLFNYDYEWTELSAWFEELMAKYRPWAVHIAEWMDIREASVKKLEFPYEYRPGQKKLAADVYKTIYHRKKLFLEAPTGTGKTLAVLFPALKAMGEGLVSYVFFLTAKNIGANAAKDALELMRSKGGLRMKSVNLIGKERACISAVPHCNPDECVFAKGHFDRVNEVLYSLVTLRDSFDRESIEKAAIEGNVCPYALARDLTEFSDCIICDYNYVFDPSVSLRHFFGEQKRTGEYLFLVDEAHNLVDRARGMYSAELSLRHLGHVKSLIRGIDRRLSTYMNGLISCMEALADRYEESGERYILITDIEDVNNAASRVAGRFMELMHDKKSSRSDEKNDQASGQMSLPGRMMITGQMTLPGMQPDIRETATAGENKGAGKDAGKAEEKAEEKAEGKAEGKAERFGDEAMQFYFDLLGFLDICDRVDQRYRIYVEKTEKEDIRLKLLCVDPSHNLAEYLAYGRSAVFFSATLLPVSYYMDLLTGTRDDYTVYATSIFDPQKLGVFVDTAVTSRYARRGVEEYRKIAEHIIGITGCHKGNYLVFFPSYLFLENVYKEYEKLTGHTDQRCICQVSDMTESQREDFLAAFESKDEKLSTIGFCVLGGLFSEGIDLTGEKLIGAIIVGTGLPQISNEKDILKAYFDDNGRDGFDYAMKIPGMNKVLQAAGRVIRTENDTGVIALLDERFDKADHKVMFPREWLKVTKITGCEFNSVKRFWEIYENNETDGMKIQ